MTLKKVLEPHYSFILLVCLRTVPILALKCAKIATLFLNKLYGIIFFIFFGGASTQLLTFSVRTDVRMSQASIFASYETYCIKLQCSRQQ